MRSAVKMMDADTTDPRGFACCLLIPLLILPPDKSSQTARDYERALADFHKGDYSSAAELFVKVEVASAGATEALLFEGRCLIHLEKYQDAERALRSSLGVVPIRMTRCICWVLSCIAKINLPNPSLCTPRARRSDAQRETI